VPKFLKIILIVISVVYVIANLLFYIYQEKLIFLDTQLAGDHNFLFEHPFEELTLAAEDGGFVHALRFKADRPKGIIVYQHGNAGDLERWGNIGEKLVQYNYDVLIWDYRGYGKSTGTRTQKTLFADAQLIYDHAKGLYKEDSIVIYGRSLGTGLSTHLAANNSPQKLILETPYYSLKDLVDTEYSFMITKRFLRYPIRSDKYVQDITCPTLIFHGTGDDVVKYKYGKRLFDAIPGQKKELVTIEGGEHNNLADYPIYWERLEKFLN